ncbi:MAG TPA: OmpA family protein, partial [Bradyrhizobium sp.]|nr:OmpA family protein [Bradyrhizobium sp.]
MTSFHGLSALKAIALGAALSMTAGFAFAADSNVSADQIVNALRAKSPTRGLSAAAPQTDAAARAKEISFVGQVRNRNTRSLSLNEREQ